MLHRGQRVQCISTAELGMLGYGDEIYPTQGAIYTVRDLVAANDNEPGVLLEEIRNDRLPYTVNGKIVDFEKCFAAWRFRPLVEGEVKREEEERV